jgi:hypothetical protein
MLELQQIDRGSLGVFLRLWYGTEHHPDLTRQSGDLTLPAALEDWYILTGGRLQEFSRYYRFLGKSDLDTSTEIVGFCSSPHDGDFWWGYEAHGADPLVFESEDRRNWQSTGNKLSEMLLYIAVSSAAFASDCGLVNMTSDRQNYEQVIARLEPLRPNIWAWPDPNVRFHFADGVIAQAGHTGGQYGYQVILGAISDEKLSPFDQMQWEWDSRTHSR